jgi:hypothetical protein
MPKQASPYLSRLHNLLKQKLGNIARAECNKQAALRKAKEALTKHFLLVVAYTERKVRLHIKLSSAEKTVLIKTHVADALTDFGKILDDRRQ